MNDRFSTPNGNQMKNSPSRVINFVVHYKDGGKGRSKAQKRELLFRQQGGLCILCNKPMSKKAATLDHVVPRKFGGSNRMINLRAVHGACNNQRGSSMADLFVDLVGIRALRWHIKEL